MQPLLTALKEEGYEFPTPIQQQAIPHILAQKDLLGVAQTGTGKTAAFALPILQLLAERNPPPKVAKSVRALILTPTRELAAQIAESFDRYGKQLKLSNAVIFGGVGQNPQAAAIRRGVDVLVATPGRLLDLIEQRLLDLSQIEIFVLDEADRMLDMGFIHDVRKTLKMLPQKRHSLFFSATMPPDIQRLAQDILRSPIKVEVTPIATTAEKIKQSIYFVEKSRKRDLLEKLLEDSSISRALVFTRTKHGADKVARFLSQGGIPTEAIHGNKSQNNRVRALNNFKDGSTRILVATDIAARGIDIDGVTHVINFELPNVPESYVHRIGRTARAGAEGIAISFCDTEEREYLRDIERLIRIKIDVAEMDLGADTTRRAPDSESRSSQTSHRSGRGHAVARGPRSSSGEGQHRGAPFAGRGPGPRTARRNPQGPRPNGFAQRPNPDAKAQGAESSGGARRQPAHSPQRGTQQRTGRSTPSGAQRSRPSESQSRNSRPQNSSAKAVDKKQPWWKKLLPGRDE